MSEPVSGSRQLAGRAAPAMARWNSLLPVLVVCATVAVRLVYFAELADTPLFGAVIVDESDYHQMASSIAGGAWVPEHAFWHEPLYPYVLAAWYRLVGAFPTRGLLLNLIFEAATSLLVLAVGRRLFSPRVGLAAALLYAVYGTAVFCAGQLLSTALVVMLGMLALWLLLLLLERPGLARAAALGLVLALAALAKGSGLLLAPALGLVALARLPRGRRRLVLATAAAWAILIAPVSVHNTRRAHGFLLISHNEGINIWIGNNPDFETTVAIRPGPAWGVLVFEPVRAGVRGEAAESRYFLRKTLAFAASQPGRSAGLLVRKTRQLLSGDEIGRNQAIYPQRAYARLLAVLLWKHGLAFPAGLALPLGLAGLALALARRRPGAGPAAAYLLACGAGVVLVFVTARYRLPMVPLLLIFAAAVPGEVAALARERRWRLLLGVAVLLVALALVANRGAGPMATRFEADVYQSLGVSHQRAGRVEVAARLYRQALEVDPRLLTAVEGLAMTHWMAGRIPEARAAFERALALGRDQDLLAAAAMFFAATGDPDRAAALRAEARGARATPAGGFGRWAPAPRAPPARPAP